MKKVLLLKVVLCSFLSDQGWENGQAGLAPAVVNQAISYTLWDFDRTIPRRGRTALFMASLSLWLHVLHPTRLEGSYENERN